jgi:hypothetical protein
MAGAVAILGLALTVALLPVPGGVLFAPLPFLLFLAGLVGVFVGQEDRTVRQHNPAMNPRRWRDGS